MKMKHVKKIASLLLALVMVFGMTTTVFAANDGSITITNATKGESYAVYKVFDLTYEGDAVAYSFTKTADNEVLYNALTGVDSPFTLNQTTTANVYNVSLQAGKTAADVSSFLTANENNLTRIGSPITAVTNEVKFENLSYGYYYVTSSLGTVVTLDSTMKDVRRV